MAAGDYCTLAELKDWIGGAAVNVTADDLNFGNVITSVSRWIDQYCQRRFGSVTETRVLDACTPTVLELGAFDDLASMTTLKTDQNLDGVYETTWAASDYQLLPLDAPFGPEPRPYRSIRSTGGRAFPLPAGTGRIGLVQIAGVWGWPATPASVNQACLIQCHRIFKRKDAPEGMMGFADFGVVRMQSRLDPDVAAMLDPYQRRAVRVA